MKWEQVFDSVLPGSIRDTFQVLVIRRGDENGFRVRVSKRNFFGVYS